MLQKYKKPWINNFKFNGDKVKQNSETCANPTGLKCKILQPSCKRPNWNKNRFILRKRERESYSLRHKPSNDRKIRNNKHIT